MTIPTPALNSPPKGADQDSCAIMNQSCQNLSRTQTRQIKARFSKPSENLPRPLNRRVKAACADTKQGDCKQNSGLHLTRHAHCFIDNMLLKSSSNFNMFLPIPVSSRSQIRPASKTGGCRNFFQPAVRLPGHFFRLGIAAILLLTGFSGLAQAVTLTNPSFEKPACLDGRWSYLANDGVAGGWEWTATQTNAGIISGGGISGRWTGWVNLAPNGTHVAFLQNNATMSQTSP